MSSNIVKYSYSQIISIVLADRNPNASIAQICRDNEINPRMLGHWRQQYARCRTEELRYLAEIYNPRVTERREVISVKN